ncbi:MAG: hypothetical protein ACR2RB_18915 [Gammaproteobacteria bacterium]
MIGFSTVAATLTAVALLMVIQSTFRKRPPRHDSTPDLVTTALYQDKLCELEHDLDLTSTSQAATPGDGTQLRLIITEPLP